MSKTKRSKPSKTLGASAHNPTEATTVAGKKKRELPSDTSDSEDAPKCSCSPVDKSDTDNLSEDSPTGHVPAKNESGQEKEVEVLSHKERRKRRKLLKQNPDWVPETASVPKPSRSTFGIWVGNMLYNTTQADVEGFFSSCGAIQRLHMPPGKKPGQNAGFAYVDFDCSEALDNALAKSENLLGGRKLLIKRSTDYTGRPAASKSDVPGLNKSARKILDRQRQPPAACLFFGNLSFETTSESIMNLLRSNHTEDAEAQDVGVRKVRLGTFEDTGKCKGFGFVDFLSIQAATRALTNPKNFSLQGRQLTIEYASAEAVRRGGGARPTTAASSTFRKRPQASQAPPVASNSPRSPASKAPPPLPSEPTQVTSPAPAQIKKKEFLGRLTPGAALANARRAPVGIVRNPQQVGKKIVFD